MRADSGRARSGAVEAVIEPVPAFTKSALTDEAIRRRAPQAAVHSDGLGVPRAVVDLSPAHTVIEAGPGKAGTEVDGARREQPEGHHTQTAHMEQTEQQPRQRRRLHSDPRPA